MQIKITLLAFIFLSCHTKTIMKQDKVLYSSNAYTLFSDKVKQGKFESKVISANYIVSNYVSPANTNFSENILFKFSINEKDNELPYGENHQLQIKEGNTRSPIIIFGQKHHEDPSPTLRTLKENTPYTIRLDMSGVFDQMDSLGYYETSQGTRIAKSDFKGVYIAGGSEPLSWDFVNLDNKGLKLHESEDKNIYTITILFNPYDHRNTLTKEWKKTWDTSDKPTYTSDQPIVDALYNLSLEEAKKNIEPDSTLRTGAKWEGVWTRDISYSIFLAFAYHEPEVAKISLLKKVKRDRIIQDTGSGGAWPISSDRTVWAIAAWEIYKVTGDIGWLKKSYQIIKNTLEDDVKTLTSSSGLNKGESSFLDWREQTYPKWMDNADIYVSENLGTNVVHFQANKILAMMASALGEPSEIYNNRSEKIKNAINEHLWMPNKGYYAQYRYGKKDMITSDKFEALGESLAILFDVADEYKSKDIIRKAPLTAYGTTCIYPQIPNIPPYHNDAIWPFVQAFWNMASAKVGNEKALTHGMAAMYRASGLFLSNYENFVAESGDYKGTEINSDRMLWSIAGNLSMVHRIFMGMSFGIHGIMFNPVVPSSFAGTKKLQGFKYRDAILNITVKGFGKNIKSFSLNGKKMQNAYLDAAASGIQYIVIELDNLPFDTETIQLVDNKYSPEAPVSRLDNNVILWQSVPNVASYRIYKNGIKINSTQSTFIKFDSDEKAEYAISSVDYSGHESFVSEPILVYNDTDVLIIQPEDHSEKSNLPHTNYSGNGFIEITKHNNTTISFEVDIPKDGNYLTQCRYANGSGPWNTDNKCAIRSLYANKEYVGPWVFPQRGNEEWSDWGMTNGLIIRLPKGKNVLTLQLEEWNTNMNIDINTALIDFIQLIHVEN